MIFVREDIPSKKLIKHTFPDDIEGLFIEINLRKCKWLLFGSYHPLINLINITLITYVENLISATNFMINLY